MGVHGDEYRADLRTEDDGWGGGRCNGGGRPALRLAVFHLFILEIVRVDEYNALAYDLAAVTNILIGNGVHVRLAARDEESIVDEYNSPVIVQQKVQAQVLLHVPRLFGSVLSARCLCYHSNTKGCKGAEEECFLFISSALLIIGE